MATHGAYVLGFCKTAMEAGIAPETLVKSANRAAVWLGSRIGGYITNLLGGSVARSKAMSEIKGLSKKLKPLTAEYKVLSRNTRGLDPRKLDAYNARINELNSAIAEMFRARDPAVDLAIFKKNLNPYLSKLERLQKKTRGLTSETLAAKMNRIQELKGQIGELKSNIKDTYDPIKWDNRKVRAARWGTGLVGAGGLGIYMNNTPSKKENFWDDDYNRDR